MLQIHFRVNRTTDSLISNIIDYCEGKSLTLNRSDNQIPSIDPQMRSKRASSDYRKKISNLYEFVAHCDIAEIRRLALSGELCAVCARDAQLQKNVVIVAAKSGEAEIVEVLMYAFPSTIYDGIAICKALLEVTRNSKIDETQLLLKVLKKCPLRETLRAVTYLKGYPQDKSVLLVHEYLLELLGLENETLSTLNKHILILQMRLMI